MVACTNTGSMGVSSNPFNDPELSMEENIFTAHLTVYNLQVIKLFPKIPACSGFTLKAIPPLGKAYLPPWATTALIVR